MGLYCHRNLKPRNTFGCRKLEEARKDPPLEAIEGSWPYHHLDFSPLASKTVRINLHYFIFFYKFIYLFLAVLGVSCRAPTFSSCVERGLLLVVVHGLLIAVASLVVEHGL